MDEPAIELWDEPKLDDEDRLGELAEKAGAGCTCANPDFATW